MNNFNNTVTDEIVLDALLYLDKNYVAGQHIDLPAFMMDNGIHMSATMLHRLCDYGVLSVTHDGFVDQEVPEFSYLYNGVGDRFAAGLSAKRMMKDFLVSTPKVAALAKSRYYYTFVNSDITEQGIEDTLNAYWSVWSEFFPGWILSVEGRSDCNTSFVAACSTKYKHIAWFANTAEVREFASHLGMHWQTYIRVAMAHELGHACDVSLADAHLLGYTTPYVSDTTIMFERHAWQNGRTFVSDAERPAYERLNQRNMALYLENKNKVSNNGMNGLAMDETSVAGNTTKEEFEMATLNIKSIVEGKKGDAMEFTQYEATLTYVLNQPGFKGKSKLKEALLVATQEDPNSLIAFLRNPEEFGIAKSSITKYITPIKDTVKLPKKKFSRAKFDQVLVLEAHFDTASVSKDGKSMTIDAVYGRRSESLLLTEAAGMKQIKVTRQTAQGHYQDAFMWDARSILYMASSEESAELYAQTLKGNMKLFVREPLAPEGEYVQYEQAIRSASNRRLMQGTFVKAGAGEFDARLELLDAIGGHPSTLGNVADASKDRSSLSASNSIGTGLYMGKEVVAAPEVHEDAYYVKGGDMNILVVPDVKSLVRTGKYKVLDGKTKERVLLDASVEGQELLQEVTDGMAIGGEKVKGVFDAYAGKATSGGQFRLAPANKGFMVFVPYLERYFPGVDVVLFESTVKVDIKGFVEACPDYDAELRFMNFASKKQTKMLELSYQAVHTTSLSAKQVLDIATPTFDKYSNVVLDPSSILSLFNKDGQMEQHTVLDKFLSESKLAARDPYILRSAVSASKEALDRLKTGKLPIEGEFKFMLSDVFAIIDAVVDGTFMVQEGVGFKAGTAFTLQGDKIMISGVRFSTNRFPAVVLGEGAGLVSPDHEDIDARYLEAVALGKGYFVNVICYSAHDFMAQKQGGADYDGDKAVVIFLKAYVDAIFNIQEKFPPIMDFTIIDGKMLAGCQWSDEIKVPDVTGTPGIISQNGYKVVVSEWTPEAVRAFLKLQDFYDSLTLQPNRIGEFTDYSTFLHDALRAVLAELSVAVKQQDTERIESLLIEKELLIERMDYLRLVQGFEIDRSKKGGAFEEELKEQLAFIKNPGALAYRLGKWVETENGTFFKWGRPEWMKNGHKGFKANSVMAALHADVLNRMERLDEEAKVQIIRLSKDNEILSAFNSAIEYNAEHYEKLRPFIIDQSTAYSARIRFVSQSREALLAKQGGEISESQERDFAAEFTQIFEDFTVEMDRLYENAATVGITKAQFGFYTYKAVTQTALKADNNINKGRSFPFRAATEYMYEAFMQAEGKTARKDLFDVFKGRRVSIRGKRLSEQGLLTERNNGDVAEIQVIDGTPHVVFANGVQVKLFKDHVSEVLGFTGRVKVTRVITPTHYAKKGVDNVGLELILG